MNSIEDAIKELFYWQHSNTGSFYNGLCSLYRKADALNRLRLSEGFHFLALAMLMWDSAGDDGNDLFRQWGHMPPKESEMRSGE